MITIKLRRFFAILLFAACLTASLPGFADDEFSEHFRETNPRTPVPTFSFVDGAGRTMDLREFRGHYVLLNIWATWCAPCVDEMPALDKLSQKLSNVMIVALNEDHDGTHSAPAFFKRHQLTNLPVFVDTAGQAPSLLAVDGLPTTLLIDQNGLEVGRVEGGVPDWLDPDTIRFLQSKTKTFTPMYPQIQPGQQPIYPQVQPQRTPSLTR